MSDQLTREDLATMTPRAVDDATRAGRCDALLGIAPEVSKARRKAEAGERIDLGDVAALKAAGRHDLITKAHEAGLISTTPHSDTTKEN